MVGYPEHGNTETRKKNTETRHTRPGDFSLGFVFFQERSLLCYCTSTSYAVRYEVLRTCTSIIFLRSMYHEVLHHELLRIIVEDGPLRTGRGGC